MKARLVWFAGWVLGCGESVPGAVPGMDNPQGDPSQSVGEGEHRVPGAAGDDVPPLEPLLPGCLYAEAIEPVEPQSPAAACLEIRLGLDGSRLETTTRRTAADSVGTRTTTEIRNTAGELTVRLVDAHDDRAALVFTSVEHLDLLPNATLPYTYGQPATYSLTYERDTAGRVVRETSDLAMDGVTDSDERWTFNAEGVVIEYQLSDLGGTVYTERFRGDGEPLDRIDSGGYGTRWTYGESGLLERIDTLSAGLVTEYQRFEMLAPGSPAKSTLVRIITTTTGARVEEVQSEKTWTYDDAGRQRSSEGWGLVEGHIRTHRVEWDALGRETLYVEENESPSCRRYERKARWATTGDALLDQLTTCDGALFEHVWSDFDQAMRPIRTERIFVGNPTWTVRQLDNRSYDACGAQVFREHYYNDSLSSRERLILDERGRILSRTSESQTVSPGTATYEYDSAGRLLGKDGKRWFYDPAGRLVRVTYGEDGQILGDGEPPTGETLFSYSCP